MFGLFDDIQIMSIVGDCIVDCEIDDDCDLFTIYISFADEGYEEDIADCFKEGQFKIPFADVTSIDRGELTKEDIQLLINDLSMQIREIVSKGISHGVTDGLII